MATKRKKKSLQISYNAPVTLTFSIVTVVILLFDQFVFTGMIDSFFTAPGAIGSEYAFKWKNPLDYLRLFSHVLGHKTWAHLLGNLSFILLLGPLLEERYGSKMLMLMIATTAMVTGVLNAAFIPRGMLGASGVAFMMILLSSFTAISKNQIPLTFIFVLVLFLGQEIMTSFGNKDIAVLAHVAGGLCGSLFGFLNAYKPPKSASITKVAAAEENGRASPSESDL